MLCGVWLVTAAAADPLAEAEQGTAAARAGHLAEAVTLYDQALAGETLSRRQRALVHNNRAMAFKRLGRLEDARVGLNRSLALDPERAKALHDRGVVHFLLGRFDRAAADLTAFLEQQPDLPSPYPRLWQHLARRRNGQTDSLADHPRLLGRRAWPWVLADFQSGAMDETTLLGFTGHQTRVEHLERTCTASFHIGQRLLLEGQADQAADRFRQAVATGQVHLDEYQAAARFLAGVEPAVRAPPGH